MPVLNIDRREDVLRRYSLSEGALKSIEKAGLLQPGGEYSEMQHSETEDLRLRVILKALSLGFTLGEIAGIIDAVS